MHFLISVCESDRWHLCPRCQGPHLHQRHPRDATGILHAQRQGQAQGIRRGKPRRKTVVKGKSTQGNQVNKVAVEPFSPQFGFSFKVLQVPRSGAEREFHPNTDPKSHQVLRVQIGCGDLCGHYLGGSIQDLRTGRHDNMNTILLIQKLSIFCRLVC